MKTKTFGLVAILAASILTLAGCGNNQTSVENPDENAEIANPASVYCEENGGVLQLHDGAGLCMFADGSYCEEWSYYNGECKPGEIIYNIVSDSEIAEDVANEENNNEEENTVEEENVVEEENIDNSENTEE